MTNGYQDLLDCPACGEPCQTMPPHHPTMEYRYPWWEAEEYGTCQCGAEVVIDADEGRAWLVVRTEKGLT